MNARAQSGVVLVTALLLLLVLTTLTLAAMSDTSMEQRMAANLERRLRAHEAAEAGLREAEIWLASGAHMPSPSPSCARACTVWRTGAPWGGGSSLRAHDARWWTEHGREATSGRARYVIELLQRTDEPRARTGGVTRHTYYRITAYGTAAGGRDVVVLQATAVRYRDARGVARVERRSWREVSGG